MSGGVVIIGAGQAGGRAALTLREKGYAGPVTLIGDEPVPPYERPPLSKDMLLDPATSPTWLVPEDAWAAGDIRLITGRAAAAVDRAARRVRLDDGTVLDYDHLIFATGSRPRRLPFQVSRLAELRRLEDVEALSVRAVDARSVLVIGGGVIGLEVAATLVQKGLGVTVIEIGSRLLGRNFPAPVAAALAERHAAEGVILLTGVRIRDLSDTADGVSAVLSDGRVITADFAVAGIGVVPETGLAQAAGLVIDDGIVVDHDMRTADPAVFAIGDVAAWPGPDGRPLRCETWQNANITAERAVAAILGNPLPAPETPWFWTDQYNLNVQLAGVTGPEADGARIVSQAAGAGRLFLVLDGDRLIGAAGINAGRDMAACRRLITAGARLPAGMIAAGSFDAKAARDLLRPAAASARPAYA
ncbi:FAD-dependent oxidoreductase (plasmid) [Tistrella mobilis]|uniref:NAD(P)/FAD-dependent oxidoreductase n=1 Tax=Tistrella mobilis TaxID=171437 RepID=UPI003557C5C4